MKRLIFALFALATPALAAPAVAGADSTWHRSVADAFSAARKVDRLVLVELYADWCGWCKVMDRETFSSEEFQAKAKEFVLLRVDTDDGAEGSELQRRFRANSLPTLLVLDPNQYLVAQIVGYKKAPELLQLLDAAQDGQAAFLAEFDRTLAGGSSAQWLAKAKEMHVRGDGRRAAKAFEKVLAAKTLAGDDLSWARLQLADSYRMSERFDVARQTARALRTDLAAAAAEAVPSAHGAMIAERADLLLVYIAGAEHDCGAAASALATFEKGYPKSSFLPDARRAYRATTTDSGGQCS
jgi:thiol-disulfide isomerase/thioredoxin